MMSLVEWRCLYCQNPAEYPIRRDRRSLGIDHLIPFAHNGTNRLGNIVPCCSICNMIKSSHPHSYFIWLAGVNPVDFAQRRKLMLRMLERCGILVEDSDLPESRPLSVRVEFPPEKTIFRPLEAAQYFGMIPGTFNSHVNSERRIKRLNREIVEPFGLIFKREDLDNYLLELRRYILGRDPGESAF